MRCQDCNTNLTDAESTRKDPRTGDYMDICDQCLGYLYEDLGDDFLSDYDLESGDSIETYGEESGG